MLEKKRKLIEIDFHIFLFHKKKIHEILQRIYFLSLERSSVLSDRLLTNNLAVDAGLPDKDFIRFFTALQSKLEICSTFRNELSLFEVTPLYSISLHDFCK